LGFHRLLDFDRAFLYVKEINTEPQDFLDNNTPPSLITSSHNTPVKSSSKAIIRTPAKAIIKTSQKMDVDSKRNDDDSEFPGMKLFHGLKRKVSPISPLPLSSSRPVRSTKRNKLKDYTKIRMKESMTVKDLKVEVMEHFNVVPLYQRLFFNGKELLCNEDLLKDINITAGSHVDLKIMEYDQENFIFYGNMPISCLSFFFFDGVLFLSNMYCFIFFFILILEQNPIYFFIQKIIIILLLLYYR